MQCAECEAFASAYKMATKHHAAVAASLHKMVRGGQFQTQDYRKLKVVKQAQEACEMARAENPSFGWYE
jgi:hypothetical protein